MTDDAFERYVGWCRGCGYAVRVDAGGHRKCTECGLDAAPVVERVRRLRERPRAAQSLAWSMIGLGAALWMQAFVVALFAARHALSLAQIRITRSDPIIDGPWILTVSMVGAYRLEELVRPLMTFVALVGVGLGLHVARAMDRRLIIGLSMALVVITFAFANGICWMAAGVGPDARTLDPGLARIMRQAVTAIFTQVAPFLMIVICGVMLVRRWPARFPRGLAMVIVLAIVAIVDDVYRTAVYSLVEIDRISRGGSDNVIPPTIRAIIDALTLSRMAAASFYLIPSMATVVACTALGGMLCVSGRSMAALIADRAADSSAAAHHRRDRTTSVRWIASVAISSLIVSAVLLPAVIRSGVDANAPLDDWPAATPVIGIPFLLPLIGGAVRGSGRFALLLIAVAIGAAVFGGGMATLLWR